MNFEQDIYIYRNACGQKKLKKFNVLLVYVLAVWLFSTCQQHKTNEMYMADGTNGDVGTISQPNFGRYLNRFQSRGRLCLLQTLGPTNIFDFLAPLNVGRFSAFLWFHTYQNITLVQGQMRFWIGSTDMRLCPPQYNFCFEIHTIQFFRLCRLSRQLLQIKFILLDCLPFSFVANKVVIQRSNSHQDVTMQNCAALQNERQFNLA